MNDNMLHGVKHDIDNALQRLKDLQIFLPWLLRCAQLDHGVSKNMRIELRKIGAYWEFLEWGRTEGNWS